MERTKLVGRAIIGEDALAEADVVIEDVVGMRDAASSQTATLLTEKVRGKSVVSIAVQAGDDGDPATGVGLTASARSAMSWAIGGPGRAPLTLPYDLPRALPEPKRRLLPHWCCSAGTSAGR